ncbi:hypothetical protein GCM10010331_33340 [Streptomyces xanthochromogenes]|nr:DUF5994 family protein [Streptomyces xanthochromogenes]GHB43126.1 hypothetical protein GCM10010331_33340 [Streptomyces xanthochromogenes]
MSATIHTGISADAGAEAGADPGTGISTETDADAGTETDASTRTGTDASTEIGTETDASTSTEFGVGPDGPESPGESGPCSAARVALKGGDGARGLLDGAWWPYSRDLAVELPSLIGVLDPLWGRVTRIAVNPRYWPVVPHKVAVRGHVVKVGWFKAEQDAHKLLLLSNTVGRWDLLVIPPGTPADSAARLMAAACDPAGPALTAGALMAEEAARCAGGASDGTAPRPASEEPEDETPSTGGAIPASRLVMGM